MTRRSLRRYDSPTGGSTTPTAGVQWAVADILRVAPAAATDEEELAFELDYQRGLTTAQRFELMLSRSRQIAEELIRRGHRRPVEISKRT